MNSPSVSLFLIQFLSFLSAAIHACLAPKQLTEGVGSDKGRGGLAAIGTPHFGEDKNE